MSIKDLSDMIDIAFGILIVFGSILWFWLYLKIEKIHDELNEINNSLKERLDKMFDEERKELK